jgi:glucose-6-phosphate 1-dehydrogenase
LSDWKEAKETRWSGVAFIIAAGKRKHEKKTAILLHEPERPWFVQRSSPFFLPDLPAE